MSNPVVLEIEPDGKRLRATLEVSDYVDLLIRAGVTDPACRPPDKTLGAELLRRIRAIESDCIQAHGAFDWEKLPPDLQDEYDALCLRLNRLRDTETDSD